MAERKKFIDVEIPILNSTIQVLGTPKELENRTIRLDLSRKLRGKGVMMTLQIFNRDEKLVGVPKNMSLIKSYIRRVIRKRTDNVEDSFLVHCSDIRATMKPFLITRKKVSRAVRRNIRNTAREFLTSYVKDKTYNEIFEEILEGSLQKNMLPKLKKIYPLAFCEIRVFETKDLAKIDLDTIVNLDEELKEKDTPEAEEMAEEEIENEAVDEAIEEAEEKVDEEVLKEEKVEEEIIEEVIEEVEAPRGVPKKDELGSALLSVPQNTELGGKNAVKE